MNRMSIRVPNLSPAGCDCYPWKGVGVGVAHLVEDAGHQGLAGVPAQVELREDHQGPAHLAVGSWRQN